MYAGYDNPEEAIENAAILNPDLCPEPAPKILNLHFGYKESESLKDSLNFLNEAYEGYQYLTNVRFRFDELEEHGSIDDLLKHLGISV